MPAIVILGAQWGDEGKGKATDLLATSSTIDYVVRTRGADLFDEDLLRLKVEGALQIRNHLLTKVYNRRAVGIDEAVEELLSYADRLRPMVVDTSLLLNRALDEGKTVLFEGAQAT